MAKKFNLRDIILGGQDGLVNVLGIVLAVAVATRDIKLIMISGLAAAFAESISMGAVAYTSSKALRDYHTRVFGQEQKVPDGESPKKSAWLVFLSAMIGSLIPLAPFYFFGVAIGLWVSITVSALALFLLGAFKATVTTGHPIREGLELMTIGMVAAFAGYLIGAILGVAV